MESLISTQVTEASLSKYFTKAEEMFASLLELDKLDQQIVSRPFLTNDFEQALGLALESAYGPNASSGLLHLFLQRILYRINRLKFFWYDDLSRYQNECSDYLRSIRNRIESA